MREFVLGLSFRGARVRANPESRLTNGNRDELQEELDSGIAAAPCLGMTELSA
jgi:hypothetical protein